MSEGSGVNALVSAWFCYSDSLDWQTLLDVKITSHHNGTPRHRKGYAGVTCA
jgi:hypothetical protein